MFLSLISGIVFLRCDHFFTFICVCNNTRILRVQQGKKENARRLKLLHAAVNSMLLDRDSGTSTFAILQAVVSLIIYFIGIGL